MKFQIQQSKEKLTSHSGLAFVGGLIQKSNLKTNIDAVKFGSFYKGSYLDSDIACSMIGLLSVGKTDFDDIEFFREDQYFALSLNLSKDIAPSSPTIRQRLDAADVGWDIAVTKSNNKLLRDEAVITSCPTGHVRLDLDTSPMDNSRSHKEGVSMTYKHFDGYCPMFAYLGQEGYMIHVELRPGKDHSQNGTPEFLRQTIRNARKITDKPLLVVLDSGCDSIDNVMILRKAHSDYIIKRNLRKEKAEQWLEIAKADASPNEIRPGKIEYVGNTALLRDEVGVPLRVVFRVVVKTIDDDDGQRLIIPKIEVETYWTSLDLPAHEIIELYHAHGTMEQFHSEFKTDMGLERLPSGYFATNTRIMFLGMFAYNVLRLIGQYSLQHDMYRLKKRNVFRRRLRSVMQDLIYLAARLVRKSNSWWISFGIHCPYYSVFRKSYFNLVT